MIDLGTNPGGPGPFITSKNNDNPYPYCLDVLLFSAIYFTIILICCVIVILLYYLKLF